MLEMIRLGVTAVMVMNESLDVVLYTLTKAATNTGKSDYVYVSYSNALGLIFFLLPSSFFYYRFNSFTPLFFLYILPVQFGYVHSYEFI